MRQKTESERLSLAFWAQKCGVAPKKRDCPGAEGGLGQPERLDQGFRAAVQGFDDVPALLPCSGEEGADAREVVRALHCAEAAGDFLPQLHHAHVALRLVVGERDGGILQKARLVLLARCKAQQEVMSSS